MEKTYGVMKTQKGKVLEYSGMIIDCLEKRKVHIKMESFVEKLLTDSEGMKGEAKTPAANFLFSVNPDAENWRKNARRCSTH